MRMKDQQRVKSVSSNTNIKFLDLFSGAGGLSEGFIRAGFSPVAHVEMDSSACFTLKTRMARHWLYNKNREEIYFDYLNRKISRDDFYKNIPQKVFSSVLNEEICKHKIDDIFSKIDELNNGDIDLIIGGPPCQAYSLIGRSSDRNNMINDERNYLYKYYALFLDKYKPAYFLFENVIGLLSAKDIDEKKYLDKMIDLFKTVGYTTEYKKLSACDYGVPQKRVRVILVGKRNGEKDFFPEPDTWYPDIKVNEVFSDLPSLSSGKGSDTPCKLKKYSGQWLYQSHIRNDEYPVTLHRARPHTKTDLEIYRCVVNAWNDGHKRLDYNSLPKRLKTRKREISCRIFPCPVPLCVVQY